jgi:hypothetical protein
VDPRAGLEDFKEKILDLELRPLGRPAHNQSLYRLRYRGYSPIYLQGVVLNSLRTGTASLLPYLYHEPRETLQLS